MVIHILKSHLILNTPQGRGVFKAFELFGGGYKTIPLNEYVAYGLSEYFGLELVPPTQTTTFNLTLGKDSVSLEGVFQKFVEGVPLHKAQGELDGRSAADLVLFDTIIANTDRKSDNVLIGDGGKLWAIDHGFSLGYHHSLEAEERGADTVWSVSLLSIEDARLNIDPRILQAADKEWLYKRAKDIQSSTFLFTLHSDLEDESDFWKEIMDAVRYRIRYLPTLLWRQYEGL